MSYDNLNLEFFEYAKTAIKQNDYYDIDLKALRKSLGLKQTDLIGIDQPDVSKIESRLDLKLSTLNKYAKACGLEMEIVFKAKNSGKLVQ
ncbi:helix-turn-helix transcriptional regulator [Halobacteriovorax sp. XZX-3]|uniref:helix-turn-helix domain-containing protein n=1 Tax=unclassified Halobacteriovorax TaxID=2639665 RepID=UPI0037167654